MKKNYFDKFLAIAMVLVLSLGMWSCDDALGEQDNPAGPTEPTVPEGITLTATGAIFNISTLGDITEYLNEIKDQISQKGSAEFVIDVTSSGDLATTSSENSIVIPELTGFNITLNLKKNVKTAEAQLTVKQNAEATTVYKNKINLSFANDDVDLILDVPGTTATLNKLNSLQILNGMSIVKTGGAIKTFVWGSPDNDYALNDGDSEWVKVTADDGSEIYRPNVQPEKGDGNTSYKFKNIKIVKGKADFARLNAWSEDYGLDKLTIAEDAVVVIGDWPCITEIIGEGTGGIVKTSNIWWNDYSKKLVGTSLALYSVEKISNVTFDVFLEDEFKDGTITYSQLSYVPANMENVTIKYGYVEFKNPEAATASVKNCKFEGTTEYPSVEIVVPYQSEDISSFKFTFDGCEFVKDCAFYNRIVDSKPKLDENGNQVYVNYYRWYTFDENGDVDWNYYNASESLDDVPEAVKEVGQTDSAYTVEDGYSKGYWIEKTAVYEGVEFKDYFIYMTFTNCKCGDEAMTAENINIPSAWAPSGAYLRYEFDGELYRAVWDNENGKYILIPAKK